ncbi:RidA family protein [Devosia ginsengisoli]|uniref:RidA family protein n=1 Tax=Devosia ginsengisoli TaxID=400770 RepID=UPI0026ED33ED|nr:RidA family protein [Devosia ginsengisoli]MCR6671868.1 RidA family protein [Devosia ginsengisoli]
MSLFDAALENLICRHGRQPRTPYRNQHSERQMKKKIQFGLPDSKVPSDWAIEADGILYTVQWACLPDGTCAKGGIAEQTKVTLDNLKRALEAAGGSIDDVVQIQVYLTDASNFKAMNEVYAGYFKSPYPNRASLVAGNLIPGGLIEIVAQAHIGISSPID